MAGGDVLVGEAQGHVLGLRFQSTKHKNTGWITARLPRARREPRGLGEDAGISGADDGGHAWPAATSELHGE